ncbi:MAG: hypothetical protein C0503_02245 [Gemmatimonas sp.]|nr:hypothetical protein [Gemmatimonas sp.]
MSALRVVHDEVRRLRRRAAVAAALLPISVFIGALASFARLLADGAWLSLPRVLPLIAWVIAFAAAVALGRFLRRRLSARAEAAHVAEAIEAEQGLRRGSLVGLLEVEGSGVFADFAIAQSDARLASAAERPAPLLRRRLQRAALLAGLAFAQVFVLASSSYATRPDGWRALLNPLDAWRGALAAPLRFDRAPSRVQRGATLSLDIDAPGRRAVTLRWRSRGEGWRESELAVDADGRAVASLDAVSAEVAVVVSDGRAGRDSILVAVVDRPFLGDVEVTARYPGYLRRGDERLSADAPIRIPAGTRLEVAARASTALAEAALSTDAALRAEIGAGASRRDASRLPLRVDGLHVAGAFVPQRSAQYGWLVEGATQRIEDLPVPLDIEVIPDSVPRVEILAPTGERMVDAQDVLALELLAQDDYGLRDVALRLQRAGEDAPFATVALDASQDAIWSGVFTLRLAPAGLEPGQTLEVTLVARDAAPGNRLAVSAPLRLRVPTANEARAAADAAADAAVAAADAAAKAQAELAERTALAARQRGDRGAESSVNDARAQQQAQAQGQTQGQAPNPANDANAPREALGYEGAEKAREISQEQQALKQQVEQLEEAARNLEDRLRQAGALDTNLQRQLAEAQRMMREAMTPEMQRAMQDLENATQQLDGARTRQSLQQLAQQQQRMREQLERSAEMLRRAALEGQMQTLADRGQELAEQQRKMADSAGTRPPSREQSQQMQQQSQDLARQAQQLAERLQQADAQAGAERTQRAAEQAQQAANAMQEAARQQGNQQGNQQGGQQSARDAAQRAADAMQQAAQDLSQAREQQVGEWKAELTDALDRSVQEMMQLAREQDQLAQQARENNSAPGLRGQQSALQQGVQTAQERLAEESKKSALVSQRSQELMQRAEQRAAAAAREAAAGRGGQTEQAMREAADALRQAAAQLTRDRERAGNSASATGVAEMLRQMQELARQQGGLNAQMQSIMPQMQQPSGQQGEAEAARAQARQMARSQREVARQLDEISDADPTGRAQELAREARVLAAALDQGAFDPSTKARQEQLLRRMLDAGRSLENDQRDESSRREARAARTTERVRADGPSSGAAAERYRVPTWEELRGLSPDDRRIVIEYFRRLNAEGRP